MSKKALLHIPISQGGLMPDLPERKEVRPETKVLTSNEDLDGDGVNDSVEYMTVADYALYINRPTTVIYRMIRENELESIKLGGKLHVVMNYKV